MRPVNIQIGRDSQSGISALQSTGGAGDLVLDGTDVVVQNLVVDDGSGPQTYTRYANLSGDNAYAMYNVRLASADNLSGVNFTILGVDSNGQQLGETIAGPNAGAVFSSQVYAKIYQISVDAAATNVVAGIMYQGATAAIPLDTYIRDFGVTIFVTPNSGGDVTVQYTGDNVFDKSIVESDQFAAWIDMSTLTNVTTNPASGTLIDPVCAVRFVLNAGSSSTANGRVIQAGAC